MANVHRIGDYQNDNPNMGQQQMRMGGMPGGGGGGGMFGDEEMNAEDARNNPLIKAFMSQSTVPPRQENFWTMLRQYL